MNFEMKRFIDGLDPIAIASDLVKIPSYTSLENQEREVADYIYALFKEEGIEVSLTQVAPGRPNVVAKLKGRGRGPSLMFLGHTDTVPLYDMEEGLSGIIEDGQLRGRGACDMKGQIAAMMAAMIAIKKAEIPLRGDLYFAGVIDEEQTGLGVDQLVKNGPIADATIVGEATNLKVARGQKGLEWIEIIVRGKKVHASSKDEGINAIEMAARLVDKIYKDLVPRLEKRTHEVLGPPTINVGTIQGGDQPSTVPGECIIRLDRRCVPGETIAQVYEELNFLVEELHEEDHRFQAQVKDMFDGRLTPHLPFYLEEDEPIIQAAKSVLINSQNEDLKVDWLTVMYAWTDAGILANYTSSKCIIFGPGDLTTAHSPLESIQASELLRGAYLYGEIAIEYCQVEEEENGSSD